MTDTTERSELGPAEGSPSIASEVPAKASRRRFSSEYKRRILAKADACSQPGEIGQLLRREGLYSSYLSKWRAERDQAMRASLTKQRGRPRAEKHPLAEENARLQSEIERLKTRLAQADDIIEVQKNSRICWDGIKRNQVWSWDITKLKGPTKWTYFHLYVIIDIYSRCVVGWLIAHCESTELAKRLIKETCARQNRRDSQLTIHADRGSSMTSRRGRAIIGRPRCDQDPFASLCV